MFYINSNYIHTLLPSNKLSVLKLSKLHKSSQFSIFNRLFKLYKTNNRQHPNKKEREVLTRKEMELHLQMLIGLGVACVWDWQSSIYTLDLDASPSYKTRTSFSLKHGLSWLYEGKQKKPRHKAAVKCDVKLSHLTIVNSNNEIKEKRKDTLKAQNGQIMDLQGKTL